MPYENIETLISTTHKALDKAPQSVPDQIKKMSDKDLRSLYKSIFSNLPFEVYFMQTVSDSGFRGRPIGMTCYRGFDHMTKKEIMNEIPNSIREELISRNQTLKPMGVFIPFYQGIVISPQFFSNNKNIYLFGDFQYNEEENPWIEKIVWANEKQ